MIQARHEPDIYHHLKSIADTQNKGIPLNEFLKGIKEIVLDPVGQCLPASGIIPIGESPREDKYLISIEELRAGDDIIDMHYMGNCTSLLKSILRLIIAVNSVSGQHQNPRFRHFFIPEKSKNSINRTLKIPEQSLIRFHESMHIRSDNTIGIHTLDDYIPILGYSPDRACREVAEEALKLLAV